MNRTLSTVLDFVLIPAAATAAAVALSTLMPKPAEAGTNSGNYNDGLSTAEAFCWSVEGVAFSYVGGIADARRDPVRGDFDRAALEVGSQLEAIYAKHAPANHRRVFRAGWDKGMQTCAQSLRY